MSMELMVKAMKLKVGNPTRKLVLVKLADNANDQGECWPSYKHIADHAEVDRRTVMRHIKALEEMGFLEVEHRKGPKGNTSNVYHLKLDPPSDNLSPPLVTQDHHPSDNLSPPPGDRMSPGISHSFESVNEPICPSGDGPVADSSIQKKKAPRMKQEQKAEHAKAVEFTFREMYQVYHNKQKKQEALRAWEKVCVKRSVDSLIELAQLIINDLIRRKAALDAGDDRFIGFKTMLLGSYLNGKRWEDEAAKELRNVI